MALSDRFRGEADRFRSLNLDDLRWVDLADVGWEPVDLAGEMLEHALS